ncbi:hypothetical protein CEK25_011689 [Fusarium fujikuroi]|nr:hypothetical protein CEK25_011689 [Fusarium fujikuroi]
MSSPLSTSTASAEMPMPGGALQKDMIRALASPMSIYEFCVHLPFLSDALKKDPVLRTVAYTAAAKQSKWLQMPAELEGKVPGIYVIGLRRSLKDGKFLNIIETERLIDGLRRYVKGARLCRANQAQGTLNSADKELVKWVSTVDWQGGYNIRPDSMPSPQSIQSDGEFSKIEGVISSFERRCDRQLDPAGKVRQLQSPLYVGCSIDLRERTSKYKLHSRGGLLNVNKPLCLVVNILSALDLNVELSVQVVVRTWEGIPLPVAERLITTVACSFVYQHGFNAVEAGGTGFSKPAGTLSVLEKSAELLFGHQDTMKQNLEATAAELNQRAEFLDTLDYVDNKAEGLITEADNLVANGSDYKGDTFQSIERVMIAKKDELQEQIEKLDKRRKQKELLVKLAQLRLGQRTVDSKE